MPVILTGYQVDPGMNSVDRLKELLVPAAGDVLVKRRDSQHVNSVESHDSGLMEEIA
jgi:putative SOS response-associated peptidase YedK